jgi:hypothetical protein
VDRKELGEEAIEIVNMMIKWQKNPGSSPDPMWDRVRAFDEKMKSNVPEIGEQVEVVVNVPFDGTFVGTFVGMHGEYFTIKDQDDNCFDVARSQFEYPVKGCQ